MVDRIMRAIRLEPTLFRMVADNPQYMSESILIVVIVSLLGSVGLLFTGDQGVLAYLFQVVNNLLFGWLLWSVVAYFVGTQFFGGRSSVPEMLRTLGYANAPRLLGILGWIPCIGWLFSLTGWILSLVAGVIAIREAMEFDTTKALVTALIGLLVFLIASAVISLTLAVVAAPFRL